MPPPSELSFDDFKPQIYSMLVKSFEDHSSDQHQTQKLEEFVARLEEERLKIDAFKRELPLCMQLLNNAMEVSKQHLQSQRANQGTTTTTSTTPVLEEFIPLKNPNSSTITEIDHKSNWMTSAVTAASDQEADIKLALNGGTPQTHRRIINGGGGAFHPFIAASKDQRMSSSSCGEAFPELALAAASSIEEKRDSPETSSRRDHNYHQNSGNSVEKEQTNANQSNRKARRCWSPDLHRRFVSALHMLGGSQVATPKQIRELMKVDGLTNDEVKSHLQKYRLHTRRPSPSHQAGATAAPQVVVLGGIWVPPEYAAAAAAHGGPPALYGGAHAATHHVSPAQEIYQAIAPRSNVNEQQRRLQQNEQLRHVYGKPPLAQKNSSPESGSGGASESGSWKGDSSGENGGERRGRGGEVSDDRRQ